MPLIAAFCFGFFFFKGLYGISLCCRSQGGNDERCRCVARLHVVEDRRTKRERCVGVTSLCVVGSSWRGAPTHCKCCFRCVVSCITQCRHEFAQDAGANPTLQTKKGITPLQVTFGSCLFSLFPFERVIYSSILFEMQDGDWQRSTRCGSNDCWAFESAIRCRCCW